MIPVEVISFRDRDCPPKRWPICTLGEVELLEAWQALNREMPHDLTGDKSMVLPPLTKPAAQRPRCIGCGKYYDKNGSKYCSPGCKEASFMMTRMSHCKGCDKELPRHRAFFSKYCSDDCKTASRRNWKQAIFKSLARGRNSKPVPAALASELKSYASKAPPKPGAWCRDDAELLKLIGEYSRRAVAQAYGVYPNAVKTHLARISRGRSGNA